MNKSDDSLFDLGTSVVQPFDRSMISAALRVSNLAFTEQESLGFRFCLVSIDLPEQLGPGQLAGFYSVQGPSQDIYVVQFGGVTVFQKDEAGRALQICADWNRGNSLLTAHLTTYQPNQMAPEDVARVTGLAIDDLPMEEGKMIELRAAASFAADVHQGLVDEFTRTTTEAAMVFWLWAVDQYNL
jgi:hypothetical protein